jgi:hypothetical protein
VHSIADRVRYASIRPWCTGDATTNTAIDGGKRAEIWRGQAIRRGNAEHHVSHAVTYGANYMHILWTISVR